MSPKGSVMATSGCFRANRIVMPIYQCTTVFLYKGGSNLGLIFLEAGHKFHKIARTKSVIQLVVKDIIPTIAARAG